MNSAASWLIISTVIMTAFSSACAENESSLCHDDGTIRYLEKRADIFEATVPPYGVARRFHNPIRVWVPSDAPDTIKKSANVYIEQARSRALIDIALGERRSSNILIIPNRSNQELTEMLGDDMPKLFASDRQYRSFLKKYESAGCASIRSIHLGEIKIAAIIFHIPKADSYYSLCVNVGFTGALGLYRGGEDRLEMVKSAIINHSSYETSNEEWSALRLLYDDQALDWRLKYNRTDIKGKC